MRNRRRSARNSETGASLVEIVIALVIIGVLTAMTIPYVANYKKLYKSEDQALKMVDLLREAAQLALSERRTIRFEIDLTDNAILLIDERTSASGVQIKKVPLEATKDVKVLTIPTGITKPNPPNYNDITFAADAVGHLVGARTVIGNTVWATRFKQDGSVVNMATPGVPTSVNIYCFPPATPSSNSARNKNEVRAITLFGASGAMRYWKYENTTFVANQ